MTRDKNAGLGSYEPKRKRGRPRELLMPEPIPDSPENIARACMEGPPKRDWRYLEPGSDAKAKRAPDAEQATQ